MYTDASKFLHGTDFQEEINILHKLPSESSIFLVKNFVVYRVIELVNMATSNNKILVLSNSLSALLAFPGSKIPS